MEKFNGLPVYYLEIDGANEESAVTMMSIVNKPAMEKNFLKFSDEKPIYHYNFDKQIATGVALRADYPILREDSEGYYYAKLKPDSIQKFVSSAIKSGNINKVNINHLNNVEGVHMLESFFMSDAHREMYPEFSDIANGSWMVSYKIDNKDVWKDIKDGKLNGFSPEVYAKRTSSEYDRISEIYKLLNEL